MEKYNILSKFKIPKMYKKLNEGYDVVYAKRKSRKGETFIKLIINKCLNVN